MYFGGFLSYVYYDRKKKLKSSVWRVVLLCQFLVLAENRHYFVVAGKFYYDRKKKIKSSVWRVRNHYYDREKKKIQSSVWWVRNVTISTHGYLQLVT